MRTSELRRLALQFGMPEKNVDIFVTAVAETKKAKAPSNRKGRTTRVVWKKLSATGYGCDQCGASGHRRVKGCEHSKLCPTCLAVHNRSVAVWVPNSEVPTPVMAEFV